MVTKLSLGSVRQGLQLPCSCFQPWRRDWHFLKAIKTATINIPSDRNNVRGAMNVSEEEIRGVLSDFGQQQDVTKTKAKTP